mmetsp:Transcript_96649/g.141364  ORF Transcript_96649/g.141364 Transcript_96649/m.141364 type:complete len:217 (+) Transcript_96649:193-843(+)
MSLLENSTSSKCIALIAHGFINFSFVRNNIVGKLTVRTVEPQRKITVSGSLEVWHAVFTCITIRFGNKGVCDEFSRILPSEKRARFQIRKSRIDSKGIFPESELQVVIQCGGAHGGVQQVRGTQKRCPQAVKVSRRVTRPRLIVAHVISGVGVACACIKFEQLVAVTSARQIFDRFSEDVVGRLAPFLGHALRNSAEVMYQQHLPDEAPPADRTEC